MAKALTTSQITVEIAENESREVPGRQSCQRRDLGQEEEISDHFTKVLY
jgi:hypothetical protein